MTEFELKKAIESAVNKKLSQNKMTLDLAKQISEAVRIKAKEMGVNAVVAISNEGARPVLVECMDNSFIASYDVAFNKAYTASALKMSTKELKRLAQPNMSLYGIQFTNNGKIVIFGGGEPLKTGDEIIGGLGVSGGTEEQDTFLASYGKRVFEKLVSQF